MNSTPSQIGHQVRLLLQLETCDNVQYEVNGLVCTSERSVKSVGFLMFCKRTFWQFAPLHPWNESTLDCYRELR